MTEETVNSIRDALNTPGFEARGEPVDIPEAPEGALLMLRPTEWGPRPGVPGGRYTDVRVARVYLVCDAPGYWVAGHGLECAWESSEPHPPCVQVWVTAEAIVVAASR